VDFDLFVCGDSDAPGTSDGGGIVSCGVGIERHAVGGCGKVRERCTYWWWCWGRSWSRIRKHGYDSSESTELLVVIRYKANIGRTWYADNWKGTGVARLLQQKTGP